MSDAGATAAIHAAAAGAGNNAPHSMATYAIGDVHGDLDALRRLLNTLAFTPDRDQLWFTGDLVNRGPDSLGCLRFVRALGNAAITTLGNHDLALLVMAQRHAERRNHDSGCDPVLTAPDAPALLAWLRHQPVLHSDATLGWTLVHAGIPPEWDLAAARRHAAELEQALRGADHAQLLTDLFGDHPAAWDDKLYGQERLRYIANALTRQRFVHPDGRLDMHCKTAPGAAPASLTPWFCHPERRSAGNRIVFGHWAALSPLAWPEHNVWCIDAGAAWGGRLSALRLDTEPYIISA